MTRYAYGDFLAADQERMVKSHLRECAACEDFVDFVKKSRLLAARDKTPDAGRADCPSTQELEILHDGPLAVFGGLNRIREHVLNCKWCRAEYFLMSSLEKEEIPDSIFNLGSRQSTAPTEQSVLEEEYRRLAHEYQQCTELLEPYIQKPSLSDAENLVRLRLLNFKLRLKDEMEDLQARRDNSRRA